MEYEGSLSKGTKFENNVGNKLDGGSRLRCSVEEQFHKFIRERGPFPSLACPILSSHDKADLNKSTDVVFAVLLARSLVLMHHPFRLEMYEVKIQGTAQLRR